LGILLIAATVIAYQPAWHAGFIWDDDDYVTNNPLLTAPNGLQRIWFSLDSPSQYFPLTYTVFRLQHALWGLNPAGYHWFNILLHAVNALLVWRLLLRLNVPGAWLAAAIFALHPVNVESVAWITQLKNVLSLFFSLLTLLAWIEFVETRAGQASRLPDTHVSASPAPALPAQAGGMPAPFWYLLALALYALALFSKTTACTLPAALLLILWLKHKPINWLRLAQVVPFVIMGVAMGLVSMWWERHHQGTEGAVYAVGLLDRVLVASRAVWFYAGKLLWPAGLSFNYPLWKPNPSDPLAYGWLAAGAALCGLIYYARRFVGRGVETAAMFFVVTLSPLLGFIMLYTFRYTFVADHYQYAAMIGPVALAAAGIGRLLKLEIRNPKSETNPKSEIRNGTATSGTRVSNFEFRISTLCCGVLLLTLGILTWRQSRMYNDLETLWRATLARNPDSFMAHNNLGTVFLQQGKWDEAMACFQEALEIQPDSPNAHFNVAQLLLHQGRLDEAAAHLRRILEVQPRDAKTHSDLSQVLLRQGRVDEAVAHARQAVECEPDFAEGHNTFGWVLLQTGRPADAIIHYQNALKLQPDFADAHHNLGDCFIQTGRADEATKHYRKVLELQPDNAEVHNNLGWILLQTGRVDDAIAHFKTVLKIQPGFVTAHGNLAKAFLRKRQARQAVAQYQSFLKLQPDAAPVLAELAWVLATWPEPTVRNGTQAVDLAQRANRLSGGEDPLILRSLAAAYAEAGRFAEAVTTARRTLELANASSNAALGEAIQLQIKSYEAGSPFRDNGTGDSGPDPINHNH
jgi:tetratricopeptide (TPR) repeat protein